MQRVSRHELLTMSIESSWNSDQYFVGNRAIAHGYAENVANRNRVKSRFFRGTVVIAIVYELPILGKSEFAKSLEVWIAGRGISGSRPRCLEREREERGYGQKCERHDIIPRELLLQKRKREDDENGDRDDFLNNLELES